MTLGVTDLGHATERGGGENGRCQGGEHPEEQPPVHGRMVAQETEARGS